jgi:ADP-heptose:LPS heptosyltransferase
MRLLVIRISAMGDVALTAPVLAGMRSQYPDTELVLLTRPAFRSFFSSIPGIQFFFPDLKNRHKGISGIFRMYIDIRNTGSFDYVIDLHDVIRSKVLRMLFRLSGVPVSVIDKGRREKKLVIKGKTKICIKHSVERYVDAFTKAGFPVRLLEGPSISPSGEVSSKVLSMLASSGELNIGVAPYAKHKLKMWPEEYMIRLLGMISEKYKVRFWLFGGNEESERLTALQSKISRSVSLAGTLNLDEELTMMSKLDLMIAMDSSNMHMAALAGVKVISIWGGTDPLSGFGAWMQPQEYSISIPTDELTCRPCTTYGKGECRRGDLACMNWLTPEKVFKRIEDLKIINLES